MNIIVQELKSNVKGYIIWTVSLCLLFYVASFEYEVFAGNEQILGFMESFDFLFEALVGAATDITTPEGYLSLVSIYIYLPLGIFSGLLGSNIISKEERDKTAEFLFSLPVKREKVILSKVIVAVFYTLAINFVTLLVTYFAFGRLGTNDLYNQFVLNMALGVLMTQMIFLTIGMVLSSVLTQYKKSGSLTIGVLMFSYMLSVLISMTDKIDFLKYVTPFKYFSVDQMLKNEFSLIFIILTVIIVTLNITGTFIFYKKRDLFI